MTTGDPALGALYADLSLTTFGSGVDVTLAELAIESFLPAGRVTAESMRAFDSRST